MHTARGHTRGAHKRAAGGRAGHVTGAQHSTATCVCPAHTHTDGASAPHTHAHTRTHTHTHAHTHTHTHTLTHTRRRAHLVDLVRAHVLLPDDASKVCFERLAAAAHNARVRGRGRNLGHLLGVWCVVCVVGGGNRSGACARARHAHTAALRQAATRGALRLERLSAHSRVGAGSHAAHGAALKGREDTP
jgi:hypothetical protein